MKLKHLFVLGGALLMASCSDMADEGLQLPEEALKIQIDGGIDQQYLSRVNDGGFCGGDQIGLYGVNYTDKNTLPGTLKDEGNQVDNIRYTLDEETGAWQSSTPAYYKDLNTHIDLYAYYPYGTPLSTSAYEFEVAKDQLNNDGYAASDFLWAKAEKVVPSDDKVKLHFTHRLSCANVILKEGKGFGEGEFDALDKSVLAMNTTRSAQINLATGEVTATGTPAQEGILMMQGADGFRAVVVPQTVKAQTALFAITVNGITYRFSKEAAFEYVAGMQSKFTITIDKKEMEGTYEFKLTDTEIVAWEADLETHGGEARQYYVVHMEEPGTLGQLIKADKKNPNKIKNLKISGNVNAGDFFFMRDSMEILEAVNMKESKIEAYKINYNSYKADEIPNDAFKLKSSLTHYVFPEKVVRIGGNSFDQTSLSGALIIPNDVFEIGDYAFNQTIITSLELPSSLKKIEENAFSSCRSLSGSLNLPEQLEELGISCFASCSFTGKLTIPSKIIEIPSYCFDSNYFTGDLIIPENVKIIRCAAFRGNKQLRGALILPRELKILENDAFYDCKFQGELIIPNTINQIRTQTFSYCEFSKIVFPEELISIGAGAFYFNEKLCEPLVFPQSLLSIDQNAFYGCSTLPGIELNKELSFIGNNAFNGCTDITSITSQATTPPSLIGSPFNGVAKDNFTLEVPEGSEVAYQSAAGWKDFKRIAAHHDFSISRRLLRALNAGHTQTYTLRAPANFNWSIEKQPDWVTVSPTSGTGKTDVTVTVHALKKGAANRSDTITFLLNDKDYRSKMVVEQYNYTYGDGDYIVNQTASKGEGVNLVFMGDCFDAYDIAQGKYLQGIDEAIEHFFAVEPYHTYRDYFNVYTVVGMSEESGTGTVNTIKNAKFGSQYTIGAGIAPNEAITFEYACKAPTVTKDNINETLVVLIENTQDYGGICYMWNDGSAIAVCPMSADAYPYDFRGIVQHEAGGHGFGKLGDEYIYHNAFIHSCSCACCNHVDEFNAAKANGWYDNMSLSSDMNEVPWSHLIYHPTYSNRVDMFEGGFFHARGVYRSEANSCMNNNIPYFSAVSRESIVKRIMEYAGETFNQQEFYDKDVLTIPSRSAMSPWTGGGYSNSYKQHTPKFMGNKPNFK